MTFSKTKLIALVILKNILYKESKNWTLLFILLNKLALSPAISVWLISLWMVWMTIWQKFNSNIAHFGPQKQGCFAKLRCQPGDYMTNSKVSHELHCIYKAVIENLLSVQNIGWHLQPKSKCCCNNSSSLFRRNSKFTCLERQVIFGCYSHMY